MLTPGARHRNRPSFVWLEAGVSVLALLSATAAGAVDVVASAGSLTSVALPSASNIVVTTTEKTGTTAVNRFDKFTIGAGETAKLVLPSGSETLVNFVKRGERAVIDGTVKAVMGSDTGSVGGNLVFVTPSGLTVGGTGRVDANRVIIRGWDGSYPGSGFQWSDSNKVQAGDVIVNGAINAPGGIDIMANSVTIGAAGRLRSGRLANDAITGVTDASFAVNTAALPEGQRIVANNGGISIVAESNVTVSGGIDAWDLDATKAAGDVTIAVSQERFVATKTYNAPDNRTLEAAYANYLAESTASAGVTLNGFINGGKVTLTAAAAAGTPAKRGISQLLFDIAAQGLVQGLMTSLIGIGLDGSYSQGSATATATVGTSATVNAKGDLKIAATTDAQSFASSETQATDYFGAAVTVSMLRASATTDIKGRLTTGGNLTLDAYNATRSNVKSRAVAFGAGTTGSPPSVFALGYNDVAANATLSVGTGSVLNATGSVALSALNDQKNTGAGAGLKLNGTDFEEAYVTNAITVVAGTGKASGSFAIGVQDINATLDFKGSITAGGDVNASSINNIARNITNSSATVGSGSIALAKAFLTGADPDTLVANIVAVAGRKQATDKDPLTQAGPTADRIGGAVSLALVDFAADATVKGSITSGGKVTVTGKTQDLLSRTNAASSVDSKITENGTASTTSGAVTFGIYDYRSTATVGGTVTATALAVNAQTERPRGEFWSWEGPGEGASLDDVTTWLAYVVGPKLSLTLGVEAGFFASSAGATASTQADSDTKAGTLAVSDVTAETRAWVDQGANLTLGSAAAGPALSVKALTNIDVLQLAGPIPPITELGFGVSGAGEGAGGALGINIARPTTIAGIDDGVTLTRRTITPAGTNPVTPAVVAGAAATDVTATGNVRLITIAPLAGASRGKGLVGMVASNVVVGETHATISNNSRLDLGTGALTLNANSDQQLWAVAGSLVSNGANSNDTEVRGIGIAAALNYSDFGTRTRIGSAADDRPDSATPDTTVVDPGIVAGSVAATANATGSLNTISLAGVVQDTTPQEQPKGKPPATFASYFDKAKSALSSSKGAAGDAGGAGDSEAGKRGGNAGDGDKAGDQAGGAGVAESLGVAGSTSFNIARGDVAVELTQARITRAAAATGAQAFLARATDSLDAMALSGGAAIAKGTPVTNSTLVSGAYGLSYSDRTTRTALARTTVGGFDNVEISGISNGLRIGAGLSVSADFTKTPKGNVVSLSLSQILSEDSASATVDGGAITGPTGGTGNATLLGYNGLRLAAGAGALSYGSQPTFGAALTVITAKPSGAAATASLSNASVTNFANLSLRALNSARVLGMAVSGAVTAQAGRAGAAAVSVNDIDQDTKALLALGTAGTVNVSGTVTVFAGDPSAGANEAAASAGRSTADPASPYNSIQSSFLAKYDFTSDDAVKDADGNTLFDPTQLSDGSRILSLAVPIAATKSGTAAALSLSLNQISNDRLALITGGDTASLTAANLNVGAGDRSGIVSAAVGGVGTKDGTALVGSVSANRITGSTRAAIQGDSSASPLATTVSQGLNVGASANAGIFSLAGAIGYSKDSAGGLSLSLNEIARTSTGDTLSDTDAGIHANLRNVALNSGPTVGVAATGQSKMTSLAVTGIVAGSGSGAIAFAGALGVNKISNVVVADASDLSVPTGQAAPALGISATDNAQISALAAGVAGSSAGTGSAGGVGVSVNTIAPRVKASLSQGGNLSLANLSIAAGSNNQIISRAIGAGLSGGRYSGAGSVSVNTNSSRTDALLSVDGATVNATGSIGVVAVRDGAIETQGGALAFGGNAIGSSVVVNTVDGGASAKVVGTGDGSQGITAGGAGNGILVRTGVTNVDPGLPAIDIASNSNALALLTPTTATVKGVAVNASSSFATRNIAVTGALGDNSLSFAGTAIVTTIAGTTEASTNAVDITAGDFSPATPTASNLAIDVRANSHATGISLAGSVAVGTGGSNTSIAVAAPVVSDGFTATTKAAITGGDIKSTGAVTVRALGTQSAAALAISAGLAKGGGEAVVAVTPRFKADTSATVTTPTTLTALGTTAVAAPVSGQPKDGVTIAASSDARATAAFGSLALAGGDKAVAVAAAIVVATNDNSTTASYKGAIDTATGLGSVTVDAPQVNVLANANYRADVTGAAIAAAVGGNFAFSLAGNGVGITNRGSTSATADGLNYNRSTGAITLSATETASLTPKLGSLAFAAGGAYGIVSGAASLGAVVVISQSKVDAELSRPTVSANSVAVNAYGATGVDALQVGAAIAGGALGANFTYIQIGKSFDGNAVLGGSGDATDTAVAANVGASSGSNQQMNAMATGGPSTAVDTGGNANLATATSEGLTARQAFLVSAGSGGAANPDDSATARVRAQVTANASGTGTSTVDAANNLTIASNANVASKAVNGTGAAGVVSGVGTVAIVRNAALSVARLDSGVASSGGLLRVSARTGQDTTKLSTGASKAAEANLVGVSVGAGAIGVAFADAKMNTTTLAESKGASRFADTSVGAIDVTDVATDIVGVAVGGTALNVAVARSIKHGQVAATLAGAVNNFSFAEVNDAPAAASVSVGATGYGSTSATSKAASGGVVFAGNASVALASDSRTVGASVAEGTVVNASLFSLAASATPVLVADAFGIAVSGQLAAGASVATGTVTTNVQSRVGQGATLDCGNIASWCVAGQASDAFAITADIKAVPTAGASNSRVSAAGSAGGILAAANGAVAEGNNNGVVRASVGDALTSTVDRPTLLGAVGLQIAANRYFKQDVSASGVTVGGALAVGVQKATANSAGTVDAALTRVDGSTRAKVFGSPAVVLEAPDISVTAKSTDRNTSSVTAGAGAIGAGVAALASTNTGGTVTATVTPPSATQVSGRYFDRALTAKTLTVTATADTNAGANADATQASVVGGSGSTGDNRVTTQANVNLGGTGSRIEAKKFVILASNIANFGGSVRGAGGGVLNGAAALVNNSVTQGSQVNVRNGSTLRQYNAAGEDFTQNNPDFTIDATIETSSDTTAALEVGGVMQFPFARLNTNATGNANVSIGNDVLIRADQAVGIGTSGTQTLRDTVGVQIYGLAGIGGGSTDTNGTLNHNVSVGTGTTIESMGNLLLSAGGGSTGTAPSGVNTSAQTDVWNWTLIPISVDRGARANSISTSNLSLANATIRSARDVILDADPGSVTSGAVGTGHNPYLAALSAIGISVSDSGGDPNTSKTANLNLGSATITAGFLAQRAITLSDAGGLQWNAVLSDKVAGTETTRVSFTGGAPFYDILAGAEPSTTPFADQDALGTYKVYGASVSAVSALTRQIDDLSLKIQAAGLTVPVDPNSKGSSLNQARVDAQAAIDAAAASSGLIAQLATAYDTRAALLAAGTGPTNGIMIDGVFAGGGNVQINAKTLQGGGATVVATSSPSIIIDNQSKFNTVLGQLFIPMKPSGAVSFGGEAGAAQLTAAIATVRKAGTSDTPEGLIRVTQGATFGAPRTDIIAAGPVSNVGGTLAMVINNGNYTQFGDVQVGSFNAEVPNGVFAVASGSNPFTMGVPISLYYGRMGWALNNQGGDGSNLSANNAAQALASYRLMVARGWADDLVPPLLSIVVPQYYYTHEGYLTGQFIDNTGYLRSLAGFTYNNAPLTLIAGTTVWASCAVVCETFSPDSRINNAGYDGDRTSRGGSALYYAPDLVGASPRRYDTIINSAVSSASYPSAAGASDPRTGGSINAVQVRVNAQTINVSGTITAGPNKSRSVSINSLPDVSGLADGATTVPLQNLGLATGNIGVRYVKSSSGNYLQVDDVAAGAGGVIELTGRIVNTNPFGTSNLKVLNGYANISVTNNTNADLKLGTLNAGENVSGIIKLRDIRADGSVETLIYRNAPGEAVTLDRSLQLPGQTLQVFDRANLGTQGLTTGGALTFTPAAGTYYTYSETRQMTRTFSPNGRTIDGVNTTGSNVSPWAWSGISGAAPTGGAFVDFTGAGTQPFEAEIGPSQYAMIQLLSGYATADEYVFTGDFGSGNIIQNIPTAASVTITTAVRANYAIGLQFDQGSGAGRITVDNKGSGVVTLGGGLVVSQGQVTVNSLAGGIRQTSTAPILATGLYLAANGDVGTALAPVKAQVAGSGAAFAFGRNLYLDLTGATTTAGALDPVTLGQIYASQDVVITGNSGLVGSGSGANIQGRNITIDVAGAVTGSGSNANPLLRPAMLINLTGGGSNDRVLKIKAGGDVVIESVQQAGVSDTLKIGNITTPGDVLLRGWGSLVAADNSTTVDQVKLDRFLDSASRLQLCPTADCTSSGVQNTAKVATVAANARSAALAAYDIIDSTLVSGAPAATDAVKNAAALDARNRIDLLSGLRAQGVVLGSDWTVSGLPAGIGNNISSPLRQIALDALRSRNDALPGSGNEVLTLPTDADIQRGLQLYVDKTRAPLTTLFGNSATPTTLLALTSLDAVRTAIPDSGYLASASNRYNSAAQTLTDTFGLVPSSRQSIATLDFKAGFLDQRTTGAIWSQAQLDFSVPSSAFVPVSDTQFVTRTPVITARSVTLVAGNSIGNFAAPETFVFDATGLTSGQDKALTRAYIAAAGPGDLSLGLITTQDVDGFDHVTAVSFTTRRQQPLQLAATGIVNAFAATNPTTLATTATGSNAATVQGDIFLNNLNDLKLGSVVSQKGRSDDARTDCNTAAGSAAGCDSRIRLQGNSIIGVASGAAQLISGSTRLTNSDGRALVMGGLVRLEASNGDLGVADASLGALLIDARALEVARAGGDLLIARRASVEIPNANPAGGSFSFASDRSKSSVTSDLIVGDVFASGRLQIDNPFGSLLVNALPSALASENRNSRIVAGDLTLRAAGNLGQADQASPTGLPLQFDLQAPIIRTLIAGADYSAVTGANRYNYALATVGAGPAPAGLPEGNGWFAVRGVTTIGGSGSVLGARNDMNIGAVPDLTNPNRPANDTGPGNGIITTNATPSWASSITITSSIQIGGLLSLSTTGSLTFGPDVNVNALGTRAPTDCVDPGDLRCGLDLSRLALNLSGSFTLATDRSLKLRSLSANGGTIESRKGSIILDGTVYGGDNPNNAFTLKAYRDVTVGNLGAGAVTLVATNGNVTVTDSTFAPDVEASGRNVSFGGPIIGRNAKLTATAADGTISVGGLIYLARTEAAPAITSSLSLTAPTVSLSSVLAADDVISINATRITSAPGTVILNARTVGLTAVSFALDPFTVFSNVGDTTITSTGSLASAGAGALRIPIFEGASLTATAVGEITLTQATATGAISLTSSRAGVTLADYASTGGTFKARGTSFATSGQGTLGDSGAIDIVATGAIAAPGALVTRGNAAITSSGAMALGALTAQSGALSATRLGAVTLADKLTVTGGTLTISNATSLSLASASITGTFNGRIINGISVNGPVDIAAAQAGDRVYLTAGSNIDLLSNTRIIGGNAGASLTISGADINAAGVAITGVVTSVTAKGAATLGTIAANAAQSQAVTVVAANALSLGSVTGSTVTLTSSAGSIVATGALSGNSVIVTAAQDATLNGLAGSMAKITATAGSARLGGVTRLTNAATPASAKLTVSGGRAIIFDGAASATGGMSLTAPSITTTARGYFTDLDRPGALFTLRATSVDARWNTGLGTGAALALDVAGLTGGYAQSLKLQFDTARAIGFNRLSAVQTSISAPTALTFTLLDMSDWMLLTMGGRTVVLAAGATAPTAERRIATGALVAARATATTVAGSQPRVTINNVLR